MATALLPARNTRAIWGLMLAATVVLLSAVATASVEPDRQPMEPAAKSSSAEPANMVTFLSSRLADDVIVVILRTG